MRLNKIIALLFITLLLGCEKENLLEAPNESTNLGNQTQLNFVKNLDEIPEIISHLSGIANNTPSLTLDVSNKSNEVDLISTNSIPYTDNGGYTRYSFMVKDADDASLILVVEKTKVENAISSYYLKLNKEAAAYTSYEYFSNKPSNLNFYNSRSAKSGEVECIAPVVPSPSSGGGNKGGGSDHPGSGGNSPGSPPGVNPGAPGFVVITPKPTGKKGGKSGGKKKPKPTRKLPPPKKTGGGGSGCGHPPCTADDSDIIVAGILFEIGIATRTETGCPDGYLAVPVEVEKPWYKDQDKDGYHSVVIIRKSSPGSDWVESSLGLDCNDNNPNVQKLNSCQKCKPEPTSTDWKADDLEKSAKIGSLLKQMIDKARIVAPNFTVNKGLNNDNGAFTNIPCKKITIGKGNTEIESTSIFAFELSHIINTSTYQKLNNDLILGRLTKDQYIDRSAEIEAEGSLLSNIVKKEESKKLNDCEKEQIEIKILKNDYSGMTLDEIKKAIRENGELNDRKKALKSKGHAVSTNQSLIEKYGKYFDNIKKYRKKIASLNFTDEQIIRIYKSSQSNCN